MIMLRKANKKQVNCSDFDLDRINLFGTEVNTFASISLIVETYPESNLSC